MEPMNASRTTFYYLSSSRIVRGLYLMRSASSVVVR
jgi:hypothetical protein